ncbi:MAG: hypothetical protein GY940_45490 [bacterium]|nr:hypothetical protein [bacterium]
MKKNISYPVLILLAFIFSQACVTPGGGDPSPGPQPGDTVITTVAVFVNLVFNNPVAMVQAPGDSTRWFVVEQGGRVIVFENTSSVSAGNVFIDITNRVASGGFVYRGNDITGIKAGFKSGGKYQVKTEAGFIEDGSGKPLIVIAILKDIPVCPLFFTSNLKHS